VYTDLISIYADQLTLQLDTISICTKLNIMKLDDKWRKPYATFFNLWSSRVQELESIKEKSDDNDTNVFGSPTHFKAKEQCHLSGNYPRSNPHRYQRYCCYSIIFIIRSFPLLKCSTIPFKNQMTNHIKHIRQNKILTVMVEWAGRGAIESISSTPTILGPKWS
jgi:hypothetical protein